MIAMLLATILFLLAGLHLFWAAGGVWGREAALPQVSGQRAFQPSRLITVIVALGLGAAGLVALARGGLLGPALAGPLVHWAALGLGLVFLARAVGDFRLMGFFKRVRGTTFARWDTRLFSPLTLLLGAAFIYIATR